MKTLLTVFWLRRRLAIRGLAGIAGATNLVAGTALALLAAAGALVLATGLGFVLHLALVSNEPPAIQLAWTITLYTLTFFAVIVPIITGAGSSSFDPSRLLIFPVSRPSLHRLALISEFPSASHLVWYPAMLVSAVVGILIPGPHRAGPLAVLGLFVLLLVVWGHAAALVARRWLRNRRTRELGAVIGLAIVVLLSLAPAAIDITAENADQRLEELLTIPPWVERGSTVLPPSIASRALTGIATGGGAAALGSTVWLIVWLAAGLIIGRHAFDALLEDDGEPAKPIRPTPRAGPTVNTSRILDFLPPAMVAVTTKDLRYLLQSGTGRMSLLIMPLMAALSAFLSRRHEGTVFLGLDLQLVVFLGVLIYAVALTGYLQVNAFGWEKTGIGSYFTSPVRFKDVVLGKNLGIWLFNLVLGLEALLVISVIQGLPSPTFVFTGLLFLGSTSVLVSLMGNFSSIAFPEDRPVSSLTSSASATGTLLMIGCLLLSFTLCGVVIFGAALFRLPALQPLLAFIVLAAVVAIYRWSLNPVVETLSRRRDDVFRALGVG